MGTCENCWRSDVWTENSVCRDCGHQVLGHRMRKAVFTVVIPPGGPKSHRIVDGFETIHLDPMGELGEV